MSIRSRVVVLSLEGEPGVGKSHIWQLIKKGVHLDEGFDTNPRDPLQPQSFSRELEWVTKYYKRIRRTARVHLQSDDVNDRLLIVTDRSPYSGCVFTESHSSFLNEVTTLLEREVAELGVMFVRVRIVAPKSVIINRIRCRLIETGEGWREILKENDIDHITYIRRKYDDLSSLWHYTVENGDNYMDGVRCVEEILVKMGF